MVDIIAVFRTIDAMTPEERQQVLDYLKRRLPEQNSEQPKQRIAGLHEHLGHAWISDDFNDELPDSFWFGDDAE